MLVTMLADAMLVISDAVIYAVYLGQCISNHSACIHGVLLDAMTSGTYQSTISIVELYYVGRYILINQGYYTKSERGEPMTPAYPMLIPTPIKSLIAKKKSKRSNHIRKGKRSRLRPLITRRTTPQHLRPIPVISKRIPMHPHRSWKVWVQHAKSVRILRHAIYLLWAGFEKYLD